MRHLFSNLLTRPLWWAVILLFWAVFAALSYKWQYDRLEADAIDMATIRGREVFAMVQISRAWNASHGGVYAPITEDSPENPYLEHPDKSAQTAHGKKLTMINPAYMTRQINEMLARDSDMRIHLTSLKPINPGNAPDAWERAALMAFESGAREQLTFEGSGEQGVFRYMAPLLVKKPCLACHAKQGYEVGQVRGGLSVMQPSSYITGIVTSQKASILHIHIGAFLLIAFISITSLWFIRRQIQQLASERDQRKQVAEELAIRLDELERARDQLVQSEKHASLGRMVAGFAHEINTPVGIALAAISQSEETIKQLNDLLTQEEVSEQELITGLDMLQQADKLALSNLRRAADLVRSFKRTSIDQSSEQARDYNLHEVITDVISSLRNQFKNSRIGIETDCPEGLVIYGIPGLIGQLLTNLLLNSLKHAYAGGSDSGTIRIEAKVNRGNLLELRYSDDGAGMTEETREKAFEPFFTTSRGQGDSGLGLYICYNIATSQLGGTITLQSTPGQGSLFFIRFPVNPKNAYNT